MGKLRKDPHPEIDIEKLIPASVTSYSDSSFSVAHDVVKATEPMFDPDAFTLVGKEMDGLESRRHRAFKKISAAGAPPRFEFDPNAHNFIEIQFGYRAKVSKIEISTEWFTANQVQAVSVTLKDEKSNNEHKLLTREPLDSDKKHFFSVPQTAATSARVECYPDGGIARIRFYGEKIETLYSDLNILDGAQVLEISNAHYGGADDALSGMRQVEFMKGWESGRRGMGEHLLLKLKQRCERIDRVVVDTYRHVLNSPLGCMLLGAESDSAMTAQELMRTAPRWKVTFRNGLEISPDSLKEYIQNKHYIKDGGSEPFTLSLDFPQSSVWKLVLPFSDLDRDTLHTFAKLGTRGPFTHLLFMHFPNGGIHGLRVLARGQDNS